MSAMQIFGDACRAKAGAVLEHPWEDHDVWKVGGKIFAILGDTSASLKATKDRQAVLIQDPDVIPAPYLHKSGWVQVKINDHTIDMALDLMDDSYELVVAGLTKKVRATLV
jgi:predicted DNA-binding protein (MmcQ/YjbR family)